MAKEKKTCPSCEAEFPESCAFCPGCGAKVEGGKASMDDEGITKLVRKAVGEELESRGIKAKGGKPAERRVFDF